MKNKKWFVYIVECSDKTLYSGVTVDIERRIEEHNTSIKGAKYTRARRPVKLVYFCTKKDRVEASKEEYRIKHLKKEDKINLILSFKKDSKQ